ncbi:glycosyltransferase family 39 protein [Limnohabitans sp. Rim8]|uniref:ArnT family glycosyltransferase n=1 Tax=Limnohabitans sp. Rim8 TaxID=1100718 RepID=UPI0026126B9F|nr:glycosyltransferase family 39 protein [Limnohabitans sp. Rim8]
MKAQSSAMARLWAHPAVWQPLFWGALLHLVLSWAVHLSPDEAHYALYATHLDWSYYDHPPLVGWLQWPMQTWLSSDVGMRIWPMSVWLVTGWGLVKLSNALYPEMASLRMWGVRLDLLLYALSPLPHLLGFALVPDTLLMGWTVWTMLLTWRLCQSPLSSPIRSWLLLGLMLGLAGLSKYTAILIALGVLLSLLHAHGLKLLLGKGAWVALFTALLCITPVVYWNATHDWMSFTYQIQHAQGGKNWVWFKAVGFALTIWLAMGLLLPMSLWGGLTDSGSGADQRHLSPARCSVYFGLPGVLLFVYLSGRGSTLPHWVVPFAVALIPCAAWGMRRQWLRWSRWQHGVLWLQALLMAAFFVMVLAGGRQEEGAQKTTLAGQEGVPAVKNPLADLYGWDLAAQRAQQLAVEQGANTLAVMNWTLASRVAWYARPLPVKVIHSHQDQFDLWFGTVQAQDKVLLLDWSIMSFKPPVAEHQFKQCEFLEQLPVVHAGRQLAHFNFMLCTGWSP